MLKKEVIIKITVLLIVILIGLFGVQIDRHKGAGSIEPEDNRIVHRFYAPFYTTIEFDLKGKTPESEEYVKTDFNFNVLTDTGALSFVRIPVDYNKIEANETRHYKVVFSTYRDKRGSKDIDISVYDNEGNVLVKETKYDPSSVYFVDVGIETKDEGIEISNARYKEGGIVILKLAKYYYIMLVFIFALFVIPKLEGKIINEKSMKQALIKFVSLTAIDLVLLANIVILNLFGINKIIDYFSLNRLQEIIITNKVIFEVLCLIVIVGLVKGVINEYKMSEEKDKKKFALMYILQILIHFVFVVLAIISVIVVIKIIQNLLGWLVGLFLLFIMGLRATSSMSDKDVIGAYAFYRLLG